MTDQLREDPLPIAWRGVSSTGLDWSIRTRAFIQYAFLILLFFGVVIRLRIQFASALATNEPWLWHSVGLAGDALSGSAAGLLLLGFSRGERSATVCRVLYGSFIAGVCLLHLARSEAVILFGSVLRPEDFNGPVLITIQNSMRGYSGALLISSSAALAIGLWIAGAAARTRDRAWTTFPRLAAIALLAAILSLIPWKIHRVESARTPILALVAVIRDMRFAHEPSSSPSTRPPSDITAVREMTGPSPRNFLSDDYPLAQRPRPQPRHSRGASPVVRPNVVFFAIESLRIEEVGVYGSKLEGVTPNLDRLAADGIRVERAYSPGTYTPTAELGLWYGLYPIPGRMLLTESPQTHLTGLPEILREAGWRAFLWISSTDETFFKRDRFYKPRGFVMFDGNDFPQSDPRVNWGVSDRALSRRAVTAMTHLKEPFAAMVLTVNNHHPYQLPSDAGPPLKGLPRTEQALGMHASQMIQTIHYSDQALGDFITMARDQPWFERTIFVITGDHGNAIAPLGERILTTHQLSELRHRVPLVIYSPLLLGGRVIKEPGSLVDMLPTLLALARIDAPLAGAGTDLLSKKVDPERPVFAWSEHERMLTIATAGRVYHCTIPAPGLPKSGALPDEILIDPEADPDGNRNLSTERPDELERFRRLARTYADTYSWVVLAGRSGLPPGWQSTAN
jgi:arylsulfatase A-like enzyme